MVTLAARRRKSIAARETNSGSDRFSQTRTRPATISSPPAAVITLASAQLYSASHVGDSTWVAKVNPGVTLIMGKTALAANTEMLDNSIHVGLMWNHEGEISAISTAP